MKKYKKVYIEITNICNLNCNFCPKTNRQLKYMNREEFMHVINQVKPYTDHVYFHLMGEPLLSTEIGAFLKICGDKGIKVNLTTNGTLIKRAGPQLLKAPSLRKVSFSLHSFEANEMDGPLKQYVSDIIEFIEEAIVKGIICELRLWNVDSEGIKASNKMNSDIAELLEQALNIKFSLIGDIGRHNNLKLKDNLYLHLAHKFEWPDIEGEIEEQQVFCYGLRDQFGILVDGTVVPCCLDKEGTIALGNIFDQPLDQILNGERAQRVYRGFTERTAAEELCRKCGYAKRHRRD
jgi:radical SAM protein with 4Fe4S-binding SPASM domain